MSLLPRGGQPRTTGKASADGSPGTRQEAAEDWEPT